jgi:hypothetical protein
MPRRYLLESDPWPGVMVPGPSLPDARGAVTSPVPIYILDGKKIYRVPNGTTLQDAYSNYHTIPRNDGNGCTRV